MGYKLKNEEEFIDLVNQGLSQTEMVNILKVSKSTIREMLFRHDLFPVWKNNKKKRFFKENKEKFESLVNQGLSQTEIAKKLKATNAKVQKTLIENGLHETWKKKKKERVFEDNKKAFRFFVSQGLSQTEMAERLNFSLELVNRTLVENNLQYAWKNNKKKRLDNEKKKLLNPLVNQGQSQTEIAEKLGVKRQRVQQVLVEVNLLDCWTEKREEKLNKDKEKILESSPQYVQKIKSELIFEVLYQIAKKEGNMAYQKAVEYTCIFHDIRKKTLKEFEYFFSLCYSNKKYTCVELSKKTGFSQQEIGIILREFSEVPRPYQLRERNLLSKEQKEQIKRAKDSKFRKSDIIYFLKIPIHQLNFYKQGGESYKELYKESYKIISQTYEAQDLDFTIKEIAELTNRSEKTIETYIIERPQKEPEIIDELEKIFDRKFEKPYL